MTKIRSFWNDCIYSYRPWETDRDVNNDAFIGEGKNLLQHLYKSNAHHIVTHCYTQMNNAIMKFNFHLLDNEPLTEQISKELWRVNDEIQDVLPTRCIISFGFILQERNTKELRYFYVSDYNLNRTSNDSDSVSEGSTSSTNHFKETIIRNKHDMNELIEDIQVTPLIDVIKSDFKDSAWKLIRVTNMHVALINVGHDDFKIARADNEEFESFCSDGNVDDGDNSTIPDCIKFNKSIEINWDNSAVTATWKSDNKCFFTALHNALTQQKEGDNVDTIEQMI